MYSLVFRDPEGFLFRFLELFFYTEPLFPELMLPVPAAPVALTCNPALLINMRP